LKGNKQNDFINRPGGHGVLGYGTGGGGVKNQGKKKKKKTVKVQPIKFDWGTEAGPGESGDPSKKKPL